ncbi:MAG: prolipoprotein diacylglyceryl transferase [Clostridiales bacterium]|nr:prolipoprotein diacylglyceryl transferase [Clostridiales bacterium]
MRFLTALEKEIVTFPGLGWKFTVDNVAIEIGGLKLYWYGILIAAAVALCLFLGMKHCRKQGLTPDLLTDYCLLAIPFAFLGARLYYVFCEWDSYYVKGKLGETLGNIVNVRGGGLAIYGGILGAVFAIFLMSKIRKVPMATILDFAIVYIPLGQAIGRWGNFFNQEAFGTTTNLPWGMKSTPIARYLSVNCPNLDSNMPVHPTFFYESVADLAIFFILLGVRGKSKRPWTTTAGYCILYGAARFFIEGLRTDSLYIAGTSLRISQVLSLVLIVLGLFLLSMGRALDWEKKPIPERFIKADEAMQREAARRKEQKLREYEEDEDVEDRVERLAKSSFEIGEDEEDSDSDNQDEADAQDEDAESSGAEDSSSDSEDADEEADDAEADDSEADDKE